MQLFFDPQYFIQNKYLRWYITIIFSRLNSPIVGYGENHHIIPKCFIKNDLTVRLTAREHFICHMLLTKCTIGMYKRKMVLQLWRLYHGGKQGTKQRNEIDAIKTSRRYKSAKEEFSVVQSERAKQSNVKRWEDPQWQEQTRKNMSGARRRDDRTKYKEARAKLWSDPEYASKMRDTFKENSKKLHQNGNPMDSQESRQKVAATKLGRKRYYSPDRSKFKYCLPGNEPEGWLLA